jgi:hypothetical protein
MEDFQEEITEGRRYLRTADHIVSITYPLVQDNRLLITVLENLFHASKNIMVSLLHYEKAFKRIPNFEEEHVSMLRLFKAKCAPRHKLSEDYSGVINDIKSLFDDHKTSAVEFSRKDCFVLCSEDYSLRKVTVPQLKTYAKSMKRFLLEVEEVISDYEGIFGRRTGRAKAR